jgi:hypothetical protein
MAGLLEMKRYVRLAANNVNVTVCITSYVLQFIPSLWLLPVEQAVETHAVLLALDHSC